MNKKTHTSLSTQIKYAYNLTKVLNNYLFIKVKTWLSSKHIISNIMIKLNYPS